MILSLISNRFGSKISPFCISSRYITFHPHTPSPHPSLIVQELKHEIQSTASTDLHILKDLKKQHGDKIVAYTRLGEVIGGMRGMPGMLTMTSDLDPIDGIRYRGYSLMDCNRLLPKSIAGGESALPEGALWLLLTGKIPTTDQVRSLSHDLSKRSHIPPDVLHTISSLPISMHPMTQLAIAILSLQPYSLFYQAYRTGTMKKSEYWDKTLDDSLNLIAKLPHIAAKIYRRSFHPHSKEPISRDDLDWAGNYAHLLGVCDDEGFKEVTRLYLMLHADHEGGNVSAHATHLVGSALSDPYYAWTAGVAGLAGPLHGLANQECLRWLEDTLKDLNGVEPTLENITEYAKTTLSQGKVIPGFGHAVLRSTDPRYMLEREFAMKHMKGNMLVKLVDICYQAIPPVLLQTGKVKNPYPNVDAHSGVCMKYYGLSEADYYTVVFAVSRVMGVCAQLVWSRIFGMPIERPKSVTLEWLVNKSNTTH